MRILFLAMSGVRAVDPELVRMGLTLPGFVERSKTIASLPSLGLLTLAAISSFSAQIEEAYALADRLRAGGTRVVLGGPHVSVLPEEAGAHADAVVIGEGDGCARAMGPAARRSTSTRRRCRASNCSIPRATTGSPSRAAVAARIAANSAPPPR